jgi:type VI secretion system secreted protein Hcp
MAESLSLLIKGSKQGVIQGSSTVTSMGREGTIEGLKFEHQVHVPGGSSGSMQGERVHGPITITKRYDRSSPCLFQALVTNEVLEATIKFYRVNPSGDGSTEQFFSVELKNARIVSIRSLLPYVLDPRTASDPPMEEVSFCYEEITWTYSSDANTVCMDTWNPSG